MDASRNESQAPRGLRGIRRGPAGREAASTLVRPPLRASVNESVSHDFRLS